MPKIIFKNTLFSLNRSSSWISSLTANAEIEQDVTDNVIMPDGFFCVCVLSIFCELLWILSFSPSSRFAPQTNKRSRENKRRCNRGRPQKYNCDPRVHRMAILRSLEYLYKNKDIQILKIPGYCTFENSKVAS